MKTHIDQNANIQQTKNMQPIKNQSWVQNNTILAGLFVGSLLFVILSGLFVFLGFSPKDMSSANVVENAPFEIINAGIQESNPDVKSNNPSDVNNNPVFDTKDGNSEVVSDQVDIEEIGVDDSIGDDNISQIEESKTNPKQYTNQYYTNLEINYDDSWSFETVTKSSKYNGLVERRIELTKEGKTLQIDLIPKDPSESDNCDYGFSPQVEDNYKTQTLVRKIKDGIRLTSRDFNSKNVLTYDKYPGCILAWTTQTNIKWEELNNLQDKYKRYTGSVAYYVDPEIINISNPSDPLVIEMDEIIKNSKF